MVTGGAAALLCSASLFRVAAPSAATTAGNCGATTAGNCG